VEIHGPYRRLQVVHDERGEPFLLKLDPKQVGVARSTCYASGGETRKRGKAF
jgi:hypothetical protein